MATWEDGPEYAPRERPQYFADAPVPRLEQAPPAPRPLDGLPAARPRFDEPSAPVAPLAALVPAPPDERDPNRPFDVVTATLTSESAWGSSRGSTTPGPTAPLGAVPTGPALPAGGPAPLPGGPWPVLEPPAGGAGFPGSNGPLPATTGSPFPHAAQRDPYGYPVPGTPGWFAPPPAGYGEQHAPGRVGAREVFEAATPGLCICLAVGGLIYPFAPIMVVVAVFLSMRVQVAQRAVQMLFRIGAGAVAFFAVVGLYRSVFVGDPWWDFVAWWSVAICWVGLGLLLLIVWQGLRRPAPPTPSPWG